ncbi:MAG: nucleotidyltransferase domain-containing protein [Candidatus Caldarchaeum sp.]|nr:nucleotidyltransferase domain-containing protein [Candidatus Caldarchaeum sp.]MDW8435867.1 nucleotidyltransferase domain-containing protein [Candidatus Caldarchaeum sp.]
MKITEHLSREKDEKFRTIVEGLCRESLLVVLFGSRARGEETPLSDYDLLVVKTRREGERLVIRWPAQLFVFGLSEIHDEVENLNTVVLDALTEGKLLCGNRETFEKLRREALEMVERRRIRKTASGWLPV